MSIFVQVVSVHTVDATPCLCFWTDSRRFLVNAGEGTQRICVEHKVKIRKVEHVLLTDLSIRSIGGLPGLCLTAADAGRPRLSITGPEGLSSFMSSADNFIRRSGIELAAHEALSMMWHEYDDVKIACIPFAPTCSAKRSHDDDTPRHIDKSACFLFETLPILGKFDVKKAKELGVPPGPLYGLLKAGHDVTLEDGRTIYATQVVSETTPGRVCICLPDVSVEHAEQLAALPVWERYFADGDDGAKVDCVAHFSPIETVQSAGYLRFMSRFRPEAVHLMCGAGCCNPVSPYRAAAIQTRKLFSVAPHHFAPVSLRQPLVESMFEHDQLNAVPASPLLRVNLVPLKRSGVDASYVVREDIEQDAEVPPAIAEEVQKLKAEAVAKLPSTPSTGASACEIVFLGTGCAIPAKTRNVSGIAVQAESGNIMLLDAGEGTWAQLYKHTQATVAQTVAEYGQIASLLARRIRAVWISHPHADHHLGLLRILHERKHAYPAGHASRVKRARVESTASADGVLGTAETTGDNSEEAKKARYQANRIEALRGLLECEATEEFFPCVVIAPPAVLRFLRGYQSIEPEFDKTFVGFSTYEFDPEALESRPSAQEEALLFEYLQRCFGITELVNVRVEHCGQAFGLAMAAQDRWKIVYSGDCRPSRSLIEHGSNATVLIHEATFEDEQHEEAISKKHCTCGEAIDVGKQMNAETVILTHFSQRNPTLPALTTDRSACVAFDFMRLRLDELAWAPAFMPALRLITAKEEEENDQDGKEEEGDERK